LYWKVSFVVSPKQPDLRLLLDQGFPKPPGFTVRSIDETVDVQHLSDFRPDLAKVQTPDFIVYLVAAEAGFEALVTRDASQVKQLAEMWVLSRLPGLTIVTWRAPIEDPIREWGQLLAYLPEIKKKLVLDERPDAIFLPAPRLSADSLYDADETVGIEARRRSVSHSQARSMALGEVRGWLELNGYDPESFDETLCLP
jgi:hypothetical protein